jgi:hypothetical protein
LKNPSKRTKRSSIEDRFKSLLVSGGLLLSLMGCLDASGLWGTPLHANSKSAALSCEKKLKSLEDFVPRKKLGKHQSIQISENEANSYLEWNLKSQFHPCLKTLVLVFLKNRMQIAATIDFDRLGTTSRHILPGIISLMFSGIHSIEAQGELISNQGKGRFLLDSAHFDNNAIPNYLVNEIISAVGLRQKPPFDPVQYSEMPYEIDRLDLQSGYIIVYQ